MFDLEIVLPVCNKDKYRQRLIDFKRLGLLNINDKKVLISLLIGPENIPDINENWPKNLAIRTIPSNSTQVAAKTYNFFGNYPGEIQARWTAKFDDDTINDVSKLIDLLDLEYDYEREYYVVTENRQEQHKYEDEILMEMGFQRWFNPKNIIWHELEGCVVSHATLSRIFNFPKAIEFMRKRSSIPQGYNDYALACAARMCKIYPTDAYFMSRWPAVGDLAIFGGHLAHIHAIAHDVNEHAFGLLQRMLSNDMGDNNPIYAEIVNQEFVYKGRGLSMIKLHSNGIITGIREAQIWHIKSKNIEFLKSNGDIVCIFDKYSDNASFMEGFHVQWSEKTSLRKLATS
jgi:hypothetical protein